MPDQDSPLTDADEEQLAEALVALLLSAYRAKQAENPPASTPTPTATPPPYTEDELRRRPRYRSQRCRWAEAPDAR